MLDKIIYIWDKKLSRKTRIGIIQPTVGAFGLHLLKRTVSVQLYARVHYYQRNLSILKMDDEMFLENKKKRMHSFVLLIFYSSFTQKNE